MGFWNYLMGAWVLSRLFKGRQNSARRYRDSYGDMGNLDYDADQHLHDSGRLYDGAIYDDELEDDEREFWDELEDDDREFWDELEDDDREFWDEVDDNLDDDF